MKKQNLEIFKEQIREDIKTLQEQWGHLDNNIHEDSYAFNYWILSRIYSIDEEIIHSYITEYKDKGVDCYVHFEENK